jgi:hypothetical protein
MTAREIVRTGLVLGGIWIAISGAASLAVGIIEFVQSSAQTDPGIAGTVGTVGIGWPLGAMVATSVFAFLLFALTPGLYVISRSRSWAASFALGDQPVEFGPSLVLAVGLMIIGVVWIVEGLTALLVSPISFFFGPALAQDDPTFYPTIVSGVAYSLLRLVAGIAVYRWGSRGVLNAG